MADDLLSADELLANPLDYIDLPDGAFPVSAIVVVEYVNPGSDNMPQRKRLAWNASSELNPWTSIGIWEFLKQWEIARVAGFVERGGEDD